MKQGRRYPHRERMCGKGRMRQFVAYVRKVLGLPSLARAIIKDSRRSPRYEGFVCFLLETCMLLMRCRSFNAFEGKLRDPPLKKLFRGYALPKCTQTIRDTNKKMSLQSMEELHQAILKKAARNKVFDKILMYGRRFFTFDGIELFRSRKRRCRGCSTAKFHEGEEDVIEYFHRFVFLQTIGPAPHLILGIQPQASLAQRRAKQSDAVKAEGELTAVEPLVERVRNLFPRLFDAGVGDTLYAAGRMHRLMRSGPFPMNLIAVLKKDTDEPMADAISVFKKMEPKTYYDAKRGERVLQWDSEGFEGLSTCPYPLRVVKVLCCEASRRLSPDKIDWTGRGIHTWWLGTGLSKDSLTGPQTFDVLRHRWDGENCGFNDLTQNWHVKHVYQHDEIGTQVIMYAFMIAYNIFQLFLHQCLRDFETSGVPAVAIADEMCLDYATITDPDDGFFPFDTS